MSHQPKRSDGPKRDRLGHGKLPLSVNCLRHMAAPAVAVLVMAFGVSRATADQSVECWGTADYASVASRLENSVVAELNRPLVKRSRTAGPLLLDYAAAALVTGRVQEAQRALYEAILLTNDLTLGAASGNASLIFDESFKLWQGEAYERAMIELFHGIALMQFGDYENARVAFDRAIVTDRFSHGGLRDREGQIGKSGILVFSDECRNAGGSVFKRDMLPAYYLRTLCYLQQGRPTRARESWEELQLVYRELIAAARDCLADRSTGLTWTGADGRYSYPDFYIPPMRYYLDDRPPISYEELEHANLLVVAATGQCPRKVKTGVKHMVHDTYLPPAESIDSIDLLIDGHYARPLIRCLNLYGQAAGRGPSAKDLAQHRKEVIEEVGRVMYEYGSYGVQYVGLLMMAINQEDADIRQWGLLPNTIHVGVARVPAGEHTLASVAYGSNRASRETALAAQAAEQIFSAQVQAFELEYVAQERAALQRSAHAVGQSTARGGMAARHTITTSVTVPATGLATVVMAERHNALVRDLAVSSPSVYELKPRRKPPEKR